MASVRVLFLSPRECWPPTSGAKLRDYYFARGLAQGSDLKYIFFGTDQSARQLAENLNPGTEVFAVPAPAKYSALKIVRGLLGRYPLPVLNYTSAGMAHTIGQVIGAERFDAVHLDSIHFAAYLPLLRSRLPEAKVILNWHNIESELMARYAGTSASLKRKAYAKVTARQMQKLENSMLHSCYGHVVCSRRELEVLSRRDSTARIALAPNGVDGSYFSLQSDAALKQRLVFVGQMSYHANAEGIAWFVRSAWPAIRGRYPAFQISVVGSSPGPAVLALANEPGVEVTGTVPDVRPFYSGAYAAIVPLLTGGGTRLKILEAMASGTPVISTRLGAEGLPVTHRTDILFADTAPDWLDALAYLSDPQRRKRLVETARHLARSQFDWTAIGAQLLQLYRRWSQA